MRKAAYIPHGNRWAGLCREWKFLLAVLKKRSHLGISSTKPPPAQKREKARRIQICLS